MIDLKQNKINIGLSKAFLLLTYLLVFVMPFGITFTKFFVAFWASVWFLLLISKNLKLNIIKYNKAQKHAFISIIIFYVLHILGVFWSENKYLAFRNLEIKLYLILIPLVLFSSFNLLKKHYKSLLYSFVFGNLIVSLILVFVAIFHSLSIFEGNIVFQASVDPNFSFFEAISNSGNYFFYSNFSLFHHTSYMSMFILFSIIILFFISKLPGEIQIKKLIFFEKRIVTFILIVFFSLIVLLLSSKANFIALTVVLFFGFIFSKVNVYFKISIVLLWIILAVVAINVNPRFNMYFKYLTDGTFKNHSVVKTGTYRYYIWEDGLEQVQKHVFFGVGTGDVEDKILDESSTGFLGKRHNLHNEFLEAFVRLGVLGGISLLTVFFLSFWNAFKYKNHILLYFLIVVIINFFFESMLQRVAGTMFFGFFNFFLIFLNDKKQN